MFVQSLGQLILTTEKVGWWNTVGKLQICHQLAASSKLSDWTGSCCPAACSWQEPVLASQTKCVFCTPRLSWEMHQSMTQPTITWVAKNCSQEEGEVPSWPGSRQSSRESPTEQAGGLQQWSDYTSGQGKGYRCHLLEFCKDCGFIPHNILGSKWERWFDGTVQWRWNWLDWPIQMVVVSGLVSLQASVKSGVPQGPILEPAWSSSRT